jgi:WD40 repeat protein
MDDNAKTLIEAHPSEDVLRTIARDVDATVSLKSDEAYTLSNDAATTRLVLRPCRLDSPDAPAGGKGDIDFELRSVLGKGGMGVVYAARQASLDRQIALKMMRAEEGSDPATADRFLSEATITGELDHPNIVPVYDLGKTADGKLFYAMKHVSGTSWSEIFRQKSLRQNLDILLSVCDAVAFAHEKHIIHRDLKPANVMLGDFGEVLVMDWGLAMGIGPRKGSAPPAGMALAGTPAYMPPEMARCRFDRICPATEVYLLGGILYEIVTGKRPHPGTDARSAVIAASLNEIQPTDVCGELVDIALKAMATEPEDRYRTAREFQQAVRTYLEHEESLVLSHHAAERLARLTSADADDVYRVCNEAVAGFQQALDLWPGNHAAVTGLRSVRERFAEAALAHRDLRLARAQVAAMESEAGTLALPGLAIEPPAALARRVADAVRDAARRERLARISVAVVVAAGVSALALTLGAYWVTRIQRDRALAAEEAMARERSRAVAAERRRAQERDRAVQAENEEAAQRLRAETALRAGEQDAYFHVIALAERRLRDGQTDKARVLLDGTPARLRGWEWGWLLRQCSQALGVLRGHEGPVSSIAFSADGTRLVSEGLDRTVRVWDVDEGRQVAAIAGHTAAAVPLAIDAESGDVIWGIENGRLQRVNPAGGRRTSVLLRGYYDTVHTAAFCPDGRTLIASSALGEAQLWDTRSGEPGVAFPGHDAVLTAAAVNPGRTLALTGSRDGMARLWDLRTGTLLHGLDHSGSPVLDAAFAPRGVQVFTADRGGTLRAWNAETGANTATLPFLGASRPLTVVCFADGAGRVLTAGVGPVARLWDPATGQALLELRGHTDAILDAAFAPGGARVATASHDGTVRVWDARAMPGKIRIDAHTAGVAALAFSRDGGRVVSAAQDGQVALWDAESGARAGGAALPAAGLSCAACAPDGSRVAAGYDDGTLRIAGTTGAEPFDAVAGLSGRVTALAFSPDGSWIAGASRDAVCVWKAGRPAAALRLEAADTRALAFSAAGDRLFAGGGAGLTAWALPDGTPLADRPSGSGVCTALAAAQDGTVAVGDRDGIVRVWDGALTAPLSELPPLKSAVSGLAFSPGGRRLFTCGRRDLRIWHPAAGRELLSLEGGADWITTLALSADGRCLAAGDNTGAILLRSARMAP